MVETLCRLLLRIFFRRIEVVGADKLPAGGVLLAPNHPNALVDPLFVFCLTPRPVSFLAKAPLFSTPIVKTFVRALDALPVYRSQDGFDTGRNKETLLAARTILDHGGAIAIFPEGKSHDEPGLERLKTGPARIALGARASGSRVHVVPCGIFYTLKQTFRSDAVLVFGEAIEVPVVQLDAQDEPPFDAARALTDRLRVELESLLVLGDDHRVLHLAAQAARLVRGAQAEAAYQDELPAVAGATHDVNAPRSGRELDGVPADDPLSGGPLEEERKLRRLLIDGHARWSRRDAERVRRLSARIEVVSELFADHGLDAGRSKAPSSLSRSVRAAGGLALSVLSAPLAWVSIVVHFVPYRAIDLAARQMSKGDGSVVSTMKILAGLLFFPMWWVALAIAAYVSVDWRWAVASLLALPPLALIALAWLEGMVHWRARTRRVALRLQRADVHRYMLDERRAIYLELVELAADLDSAQGTGVEAAATPTPVRPP